MGNPGLGLVILLALLFLAVLGMAQAVWWMIREQRADRNRDLLRRLGTVEASPEETVDLLSKENIDSVGSRLGRIGTWLHDLSQQAGRPYTVRQIVFRMAGYALVTMAVLAFLTRGPLAVLGIIAGILPILSLGRQAGTRADTLSRQLPEALELLARNLQAGHGITEGFRRVAEELEHPVAGEFGRVYESHNLGRDLQACLEDLTLRNLRCFDIALFASSVMLQAETGGNLVEIVMNISGTIRGRFLLQAKVRALTAEARISAWILGMLPFVVAFAVFVIRPDYLSPLVGDPMGRLFLVSAISSYIVGIVAMARIAQIEI